MKSTRQRISLLKNKIEETFPEENDLFGYVGINRANLIVSLDESYSLLSPLEDYNDKVETIIAKREIADLANSAKQFIENDFYSEDAESSFNSFLQSITKIRFVIRETLIAITEKPLRLDSELKQAKKNLNQINEEISEIENLKLRLDFKV